MAHTYAALNVGEYLGEPNKRSKYNTPIYKVKGMNLQLSSKCDRFTVKNILVSEKLINPSHYVKITDYITNHICAVHIMKNRRSRRILSTFYFTKNHETEEIRLLKQGF